VCARHPTRPYRHLDTSLRKAACTSVVRACLVMPHHHRHKKETHRRSMIASTTNRPEGRGKISKKEGGRKNKGTGLPCPLLCPPRTRVLALLSPCLRSEETNRAAVTITHDDETSLIPAPSQRTRPSVNAKPRPLVASTHTHPPPLTHPPAAVCALHHVRYTYH
jgi:hypothetical protein